MTYLYLAGPMRGIRHFNFPAFLAADHALTAAGFHVHNPAQYDLDNGFDPFRDDMTGDEDLADFDFDLAAALAHDLHYVTTAADGVAVLPGWERSAGARAEVAAANALGKPARLVDCWLETSTCHRPEHQVSVDASMFTGAPGFRSRDVRPPFTPLPGGEHVDAMPSTSHAGDVDHAAPLAAPFHNHFARSDGSLLPAGECGGCDHARDVARDALDGRDDPVGCLPTTGAAAYAEPRVGARPPLDGSGTLPDLLHNHLARLSYPIPAADMRPVGECAACDAQREAFPPDGQPHDDDFADDLAAATDDGSIRARFARPGTATLQRGDEVRVTSATGGEKGMKLAQLGAIDPTALRLVAEVAGFGAQKYARNNYMRGYDWSLSYDAMQRHFLAAWSGEDDDPESGLPHLAHGAWHALALLAFMVHDLGTDDRWRKP